MKKYHLLSLFFVFISIQTYAQYQADALYFSRNFYTGSAKSVAMGGSLSAVGADISVLATNPAGMAVYKKGVMEMTPSFYVNSSQTGFNGNVRIEEKYGMPFTTLGFVTATSTASDWEQISFGINYTRTNEYRAEYAASGDNPNSSILDYYVYNANTFEDPTYGDRWEGLREDLAIQTYLIEQDANDEYFSHVSDEQKYGEVQRRTTQIIGGAGEWDFSFAANYNDFLLLGGTIGATTLKYNKESLYSEKDFAPVMRTDGNGNEVEANPESLDVFENLTIDGVGINFKFGFLLQPVEFIRFGGAIHSRTFNRMHELYETRMSSEFPTPDQSGDYTYDTDWQLNEFDWRLRTPFRANAGLAFVLDQFEVGSFYTIPMTFSFGYEYADYSSIYMKSYALAENFSFDNDNTYINNNYTVAHTLNSGVEFSFGLVKLRGGYALYTSPIAGSDLMADATPVYSGGIGFGWEHAYIDIAYSLTQMTDKIYMYDATNYYPMNPIGGIAEPAADLTMMKHQAFFTFGLRF